MSLSESKKKKILKGIDKLIKEFKKSKWQIKEKKSKRKRGNKQKIHLMTKNQIDKLIKKLLGAG